MARQRFIWPDLWSDPGFASLDPVAQVLYIGCFSNADDHGRLLGDVSYLRSTVWPRAGSRRLGVNKARESMISAMPKLVLYEVEGVEYLAFTNWSEWQKPKYPSASRIPPPPDGSGNRSRNGSRKHSGNDSSTGWVGIGGEEHKPQLDPKAAARSKSSSSTTEASYDEPEDQENPAAVVAPATEQEILTACTRFGAEPNIAEPWARQLSGDELQAIVLKMEMKIRRGTVETPPGHFVDLLKRKVAANVKAASAVKIHIPTIDETLHGDVVQYARGHHPWDVAADLLGRKMTKLNVPAEQQVELLAELERVYRANAEAA